MAIIRQLFDPLVDVARRLGWKEPRLSLRQVNSHKDICFLYRTEIVVVGSAEMPKWAVFYCPCGRGHVVQLNLQTVHTPHWRVTTSDAGVSIYPSIDMTVAPYCHYWIRGGHVMWVHR